MSAREARRRGLAFEVEVANLMRRDGLYIVGSLRNSAGGGDLIAARCAIPGTHPKLDLGRLVLVECKTTAGGPFERFGVLERKAMLVKAGRAGARAWLAYRPLGMTEIRWLAAEQWPGA